VVERHRSSFMEANSRSRPINGVGKRGKDEEVTLRSTDVSAGCELLASVEAADGSWAVNVEE